MRIILCGYHWTGCKALELLLKAGHEVYVYTHETENYITDLEGLCIRKNVQYSLEKIQVDNMPFIPDIICSIYYRYLIGQAVINAVNGKIFNLHPALLPKYRGCSSLTWAMINGETECGFTYHYIEKGCDTGNIILQKKIKIEDFDTQLTLYNRVMFESMEYFMEALQLVMQGYNGKPQEEPARSLGKEGKTVIFGCGGHSRSIVNVMHGFSPSLEILLVDDKAGNNEQILQCRVVRQYEIRQEDSYIVAIGDNGRRKKLFDYLKGKNTGQCISVIARDACIGEEVEIGRGTFVAARTYIGPQVSIGEDTIINSGSIVEHEAVIGSHVHIAPNATILGRAKIGNTVFCGAGSIIIDKISVCDNVVIGAGAVVRENITEAGTYVGIPARRVK